jgi:hypothetical protein
MADSPSVQTVLGAAGSCPEVTCNGKTWKIGYPTQDAKKILEQLVIAKATAEVMKLDGIIEPAQYAKIFNKHVNDVRSGAFKTWSEDWQAIAFSPQNGHFFLLSLLRLKQPNATEKDALDLSKNSSQEIEVVLAQVVPDFFLVLLEDCPPLQMLESAKLTDEQRAEAAVVTKGVIDSLLDSMPTMQKSIAEKVFSTVLARFQSPSIPTSAA